MVMEDDRVMKGFDEVENIRLRFDLAEQLLKLPYGTGHIIDQDIATMAWPPTGDHDRSVEGAFRAMALANAANRPEESYTTIERIQNDLDDSFRVTQEMTGEYLVVRLLHHCPLCRGSGHYRRRLPEKFVPLAFDADIPITVTTAVKDEVVKCDHWPVS